MCETSTLTRRHTRLCVSWAFRTEHHSELVRVHAACKVCLLLVWVACHWEPHAEIFDVVEGKIDALRNIAICRRFPFECWSNCFQFLPAILPTFCCCFLFSLYTTKKNTSSVDALNVYRTFYKPYEIWRTPKQSTEKGICLKNPRFEPSFQLLFFCNNFVDRYFSCTDFAQNPQSNPMQMTINDNLCV